jgi:hypothetical protein
MTSPASNTEKWKRERERERERERGIHCGSRKEDDNEARCTKQSLRVTGGGVVWLCIHQRDLKHTRSNKSRPKSAHAAAITYP